MIYHFRIGITLEFPVQFALLERMKKQINFAFRIHPRSGTEVKAISDERIVEMLHSQYEIKKLWFARPPAVKNALDTLFQKHHFSLISFLEEYNYYNQNREKYQELNKDVKIKFNDKVAKFNLEPLN